MAELNNKLIAKNAIMLTLRMLVVTIIGIFTSRIVLNTLGVENYGVYGLVGGIVGMCNFLNAAMSSASSRFITFEIGTGNIEKLKKIFSTSITIHCGIALVAILVAETVGLWFVNYKLVIPEQSMFAANVVYQLSVFSLAVGFTQVPYSAAIMAHEKMTIYAYFEILNVTVKLMVLYLLMVIPFDKMIWYAFMLFIWSVIQAMCYRIYCVRNFTEATFNFKIDKGIAKSMLSYSGYDLFGNLSCTVYIQGLPMVLNLFYGVIANTAAGIGTTLDGTVKGFSWAVSNAFVPQITKQYAAGNIVAMEDVMCKGIKFSVLVFAIIGLPFVIETERILYLWLGQIPPYATDFVRCIMLVTIVDYITMSNNRAIHATGNIKWISLISGNFYLLCPFISYGVMKFGTPAYTPYIVNASMLLIVSIIGIIILKRQIPLYNVKKYIHSLVCTYGAVFLTLFVLIYLKNSFISDSYNYLHIPILNSILVIAVVAVVGFLSISIISLIFVFNESERRFMFDKIIKIFSKFTLIRA